MDKSWNGSATRRADPQAADEVLIFGKEPRSNEDAYIDAMLSECMHRSSPVVGPYLREADKVYRYIWDLMAMTLPQRRKAVRKAPFRDLLLAEVLCNEGAKTASRNPDLAEDMAVLAEWIASQPWPQDPERATLIRVRARVYRGNARRLLRDFKGAELWFGAAFAELHELSPYEQSFFYNHLSDLREDQGQLDEAASLLMYAMLIHSWSFRSQNLPAHGVVELAYLYLKRNDPGHAMSLLTQLTLEEKKDRLSGLYSIQIDLFRAICLATLGLTEPARELLEQSLPQRRLVHERDRQLPYEWLECRIAVHLGDLDQAIPRLEAIFRWLPRSGLADICLCAIDLTLAYTKAGQAEQRFPGLLKKIAELEGAADQPWALGALWWFREAVDRGWDPAQAAREAANIVHLRESSFARLARRMRNPKGRKGAAK